MRLSLTVFGKAHCIHINFLIYIGHKRQREFLLWIKFLFWCYVMQLPVAPTQVKPEEGLPKLYLPLSPTWSLQIAFKWKYSTAWAKGGLCTEGSISNIGKNNRIPSLTTWFILQIIIFLIYQWLWSLLPQDPPDDILLFFFFFKIHSFPVVLIVCLLQTTYFRDVSLKTCKTSGFPKRLDNSENFV